jgi:uncharacterized protein
VVLEPR